MVFAGKTQFKSRNLELFYKRSNKIRLLNKEKLTKKKIRK